MTQLGDIMYVVRNAYSIIKMFTADTLSPLGEGIDIEGMTDPGDIVACHHDRQLYVAGWNDLCIWRVSVDDNSYVKWLRTGNVNRLSLTKDRLLLTSPPRNLRQYSTTDSRQLRNVQLPRYVKHLYHGIESLRQTFIVGHKGTPEGEQQNAVSELFKFCHILKCHQVK